MFDETNDMISTFINFFIYKLLITIYIIYIFTFRCHIYIATGALLFYLSPARECVSIWSPPKPPSLQSPYPCPLHQVYTQMAGDTFVQSFNRLPWAGSRMSSSAGSSAHLKSWNYLKHKLITLQQGKYLVSKTELYLSRTNRIFRITVWINDPYSSQSKSACGERAHTNLSRGKENYDEVWKFYNLSNK